ncbi:hypothetical protein MPH_09222 [Macrophomina phaseolina MS6]|uniref:Uncharacterized protein n=1 Tax=Macrophomina phaseolina (strain MS6) TaxID=1126212 RepID=K2RG87_MACPH|nr:hypothetical protein MPH_09222 [Macrophomina phaseolina MS6]
MLLSPPVKYARLAAASGSRDDDFDEDGFDMKQMEMAAPGRCIPPFLGRKAAKIAVGALLLLSAVAIVAAAQAGYPTISWNDSPLPPRQRISFDQCGSTSEEARARGCRFEMHNFAWVPAECYDEELGDEWDSHMDWAFSRTANNSADTDAAFVAECRAGNVQEAWVPWYQHMAHCSLIMKKYMRSVMFNRPMDNWTSHWHHGEHCTNMMQRYDVDPFFFNSLLHLKFPTCDYSWRDVPADPAMNKLMPTWHGHQ